MSFDLKQLESFAVAAEVLSFSIAADRLGTVQSAISQHIAKLEQSLGVTLLDRGRGRAMQLTTEGRQFLGYAHRILRLSDEARDSVQPKSSSPPLSVGVTSTLALSVLPQALEQVFEHHPKARISVACARSATLWEGFMQTQFDMIACVDQGAHPTRRHVRDIGLAWAAGPRFTLDQPGPVPLAFLTDARDLRRFALDALDRVGRSARLETCPDPLGLRSLVLANRALTVMPRVAIAPPIRALPIDANLPDPGHLALSIYQHPLPNPTIAQALADALGEVMEG